MISEDFPIRIVCVYVCVCVCVCVLLTERGGGGHQVNIHSNTLNNDCPYLVHV